jgi:hypothetical protein
MSCAVQPGDSVIIFFNGLFFGIDGLTLRIRVATAKERAATPMSPNCATKTWKARESRAADRGLNHVGHDG